MLLKISCRHPGEFKKYMDDPTIIPTGVVLINYQEWEYTSIGTNPSFEELVDYVNKHDVPLHIINGSAPDTMLLYDDSNLRYKNIQPIIYWPTYFLTCWFEHFRNGADTSAGVNELLSSEYNKEFDHLYVSLNNKPHPHRCLQIDLLAKNNILDKGAVTWNSWYLDQGRMLDQYIDYNWRWWEPKIMVLDEINGSGGWNTQLPNEYKHAFMQLTSETSVKAPFMTEKIVPALLFNKPFLVSSIEGFHAMLQSYGFVLYDEVFDYSFDSEPDIEKRFDMLTQNIVKLKDHSKDQLAVLYQQLLPKLIHNKRNLFKIATDAQLYPEFLLNLLKVDHELLLNEDIYHYYQKYKFGGISI